MRHLIHRLTLGLIVVATVLTVPSAVTGQEASPVPDTVEVVAAGLTNPRGLTWRSDGALYVAVSGTGGIEETTGSSVAGSPAAGTPEIAGVEASVVMANDAGVVRIENGCPVVVAGGLPSSGLLPIGWVVGTTGLAELDGALYVLVDGGGEAGLHPDEPNGVYRVETNGTATLVADLSAWFRANPTEHLWGEITPDGEPYGLVAGDGVLWLTESNHEQVLTVTPDGTISRFIDLSPLGDVVPTGIALAPEGGIYVGFLTAVPWPDGAAKVIHIAEDGTMTDVWTGLTAVTSIALGPDGTLYATEMATGNTDEDPFYHPDTGRVVRQTGPDSLEVIASGLNFPVGLTFGPDGGLYVSGPAVGVNAGLGTVLRLNPAAGPVDLAGMTLPAPDCPM